MKSLFSLSSLVILISLLASCNHSDDDMNTLSNAATAGKWKIAFYFDKKDETSDFSGYTFNFNTDGTATAQKGATTVAGTWSVSGSKFILDFGGDPVLDELNDDWLIVEKTNSSIKLKDDNSLQDDQLNFIKL
jgi:hypothetical protein